MKKTLFIIIPIIIITIIILMPKGGVGTGGISKEEFDKIIIGTQKEKVSEIIDPENKWKDNNIYAKCVEQIGEIKENKIYTLIYKYYGETSGYAIIKYQADLSYYFIPEYKVVEKTQYDLK